jgi:hypothetical protein
MKKRFGILCVFITLVMTACTLDGANLIGPAGGYVFYDKGNYSDDWRYLEAAPESAGTGDWETAVQLCKDYRLGGYADWFLPGKDELKEMLSGDRGRLFFPHGFVLKSNGEAIFWSSDSDEEDSSSAWGTNVNAYSKTYPKTDSGTAWPVRRF